MKPQQQTNPKPNPIDREGNFYKISHPLNACCFVATYGFKLSGLPPDVTDEEFSLLFQDYEATGKKTAVIMRDNGICAGYAYINFTDLESGKKKNA